MKRGRRRTVVANTFHRRSDQARLKGRARRSSRLVSKSVGRAAAELRAMRAQRHRSPHTLSQLRHAVETQHTALPPMCIGSCSGISARLGSSCSFIIARSVQAPCAFPLLLLFTCRFACEPAKHTWWGLGLIIVRHRDGGRLRLCAPITRRGHAADRSHNHVKSPIGERRRGKLKLRWICGRYESAKVSPDLRCLRPWHYST